MSGGGTVKLPKSIQKNPVLVGSCIVSGLGVCLVALVAGLMLPRDPACIKLEAKIEVAKGFCDGLAARTATERCGGLSDDPDILGQCMRIVIPGAHSACMDYLEIKRLKEEVGTLCR